MTTHFELRDGINVAVLDKPPAPPKVKATLAYKDGGGTIEWKPREGYAAEDWHDEIWKHARQPFCRENCGSIRMEPVDE